MRLILSSLIIVFLAACKTTYEPVETPEKVYPWPTPLMRCEITSVSISKETGSVTIPYRDNLNIEMCNNDKIRYIKDLTALVCKLQPSSPKCKELNKDDSKASSSGER